MYDSGTTAAALIALVQAEADISVTIASATWYRWINEVEQLLYTEIIKELKSIILTVSTSTISMASVTALSTEQQAIFEDIYKVYANGKELQKSSLISSISLSGYKSVWYKTGGNIGISLAGGDSATSVTIVYYVRPKLKASADSPAANIKLPTEFLEMMACRLRGEAYKLANDDGQSAKWLTDYNSYVETFKVWVTSHNAGYGE
jgi:hypothetical protein